VFTLRLHSINNVLDQHSLLHDQHSLLHDIDSILHDIYSLLRRIFNIFGNVYSLLHHQLSVVRDIFKDIPDLFSVSRNLFRVLYNLFKVIGRKERYLCCMIPYISHVHKIYCNLTTKTTPYNKLSLSLKQILSFQLKNRGAIFLFS
jgi:hypothetical protein